MRRFLLAFLLTVALLGLLAAPAVATQPIVDFRVDAKTAYVFTYNGGSWFETTNAADPSAFVGHWAVFDDAAGDWVVGTADPIPADYDVVMQMSNKFIPRGQVQNLPRKFLISLSIPEAGVDLSYAQSKAYWNLHLWDQFWVAATFPIPAFNPQIRAQPYAETWLAPLTGENGLADNLTADMKLPSGTYTVTYTENVVKPFTDLELWYDDQGNPLRGPTRVTPYTSDPIVCTFTVASPVAPPVP